MADGPSAGCRYDSIYQNRDPLLWPTDAPRDVVMTRFTKIGTPYYGRRTLRGSRYDSIYQNRPNMLPYRAHVSPELSRLAAFTGNTMPKMFDGVQEA